MNFVCRCTTVLAVLFAALPSRADDGLFRRDNLIAWCIVPFDSQKRGPEARAAMLERLGFKHFAYDFRAEHVPTFDAEIEALKKHGVSLDAWWFPSTLNDGAKHILDVCKNHDIHPQLWVSGGGDPTTTPDKQRQRVEKEAARIRPIAEAAAAQGMKVGLYNHGGWFGEPENQLAILDELKLPNVGLIYNFHHGHDQLDRIAALLPKMLPHLLCINLNGMVPNGDKQGQKIMQLGRGTLDLKLLRMIRDSGYLGPIGILGHTQDDAEARLQDNLDGLDWLLPQLDGAAPGPKPQPRTPVAKPKEAAAATEATPKGSGWSVAGRDEYRTPPLSAECRAVLTSSAGYNILVACDTKMSAAHWELFTQPKSGTLAAYLPGYEPQQVTTDINIADGRPHHIAMNYEAERLRLYVDGKLAADRNLKSRGTPTMPGDFAIGQLVEGTLASVGTIDYVQLTRGMRTFDPPAAREIAADADTLGLWQFRDVSGAEVADASSLKNPAKRNLAAHRNKAPEPPPGVHLKPLDARLKSTLIDRSAGDVYMGVKVDADGNVFVGGREAVFVFEPTREGRGYAKRRELLKFPPDSIIMGLEFRGDDLYVLTDNALYLVPQGRVRRESLQPQRILWGLPLDLHVSFHCLAWGPDGDLYLTHGDPLLQYGDWNRPDHWGHWTLYCGAENTPLPYTGQGAVLRMKPDGADVCVVARGLRGPVGLAFDGAGNLFINDNDHESRADQYAPSRLLHVVEGIDFGWPRGWMASKSPDRYDLIEPMCDLGRGVPCDLAWYDRPLLRDIVGDRLLMCRWDRHNVSAYRIDPRGSTFTALEEAIAVGDENCRPVGIAADREGRLFVTALYMTGNMAAPDCFSDLVVIDRADGEAGAEPGGRGSRRAVFGSHRPAPRGDGPGVRGGSAGASPSRPLVLEPNTLIDARSDDLYRRQLAVLELSRSSQHDLKQLTTSSYEPTRLAGVLAVGRKLTVPDPHFVPPPELTLSYPKGSSFFHREQRFYGIKDAIDLADLGPIGSFTIARWWAAVERTADQEALFDLLVAALDDSSDRVRLQAAYFLSLLNDQRSEPLVERVRRDVQLRTLQAAREVRIDQVWEVGPFSDAELASLAGGPEQGSVDLSATYGDRTWQERSLVESSSGLAIGSHYDSFRIVSGARQAALLSVSSTGESRLWQNETPLEVTIADDDTRRWIVDLQPGSNEFLLRIASDSALDVRLRAVHDVEASRADKLDSAMLAERLRSAAAAGTSQAVPAEFATIDWGRAAADGDSADGRRLFGTLGCAKCHAVVPDQKSAGAPSLFEAKRRFTVPHLVESVLLPSRLVAELFRAQTFTLNDGRTLIGLVTSETNANVELLLPDATRTTLAKRTIEERNPTQLSPMPQGLVKTPTELRNLLAYLLSDRPLPP